MLGGADLAGLEALLSVSPCAPPSRRLGLVRADHAFCSYHYYSLVVSQTIEAMKERGVELRVLIGGMDTSTPSGRLAFNISAAFAQLHWLEDWRCGDPKAMADLDAWIASHGK